MKIFVKTLKGSHFEIEVKAEDRVRFYSVFVFVFILWISIDAKFSSKLCASLFLFMLIFFFADSCVILSCGSILCDCSVTTFQFAMLGWVAVMFKGMSICLIWCFILFVVWVSITQFCVGNLWYVLDWFRLPMLLDQWILIWGYAIYLSKLGILIFM